MCVSVVSVCEGLTCILCMCLCVCVNLWVSVCAAVSGRRYRVRDNRSVGVLA